MFATRRLTKDSAGWERAISANGRYVTRWTPSDVNPHNSYATEACLPRPNASRLI